MSIGHQEDMMFQEVDSKVDLVEMEEGVLACWREHSTFEKSLELREDGPRYVFYEGPPTANGEPGIHHVLARVFKDLFPRYKTMKGYYCLRKGGWDTHGLPVELEIEKELGLESKNQIEEYGVRRFNAQCRESVFRYVEEWERMTERIGFWIDMDDPYVTLTREYIESIWWILKQLWDRDLLYEGYQVVPYCSRCGTALSSHEQHYTGAIRETEDPSVFVRFPLREEPGASFLVWTTTPWTLSGNVALAVHPDLEYVMVEQDDERLILAKELAHEVLQGEYRVVSTFQGKDLAGKRYRPLYTFLPTEKDAYYVVEADFVTAEEGTGVVHQAPAYGADDLELGKEYDLPVLHTVGLDGKFIHPVTPWRGMWVKDADPLIQEDLEKRGLLYRASTYRHNYPFCWRCDTPLLYYAKVTWFIETTALKDRLLANNDKIGWYPEHIKAGRFGNWLENNVDWALSRERYWGTPLPIWACDSCGEQAMIGSVAELERRTGRDLDGLDLHRPGVDRITFNCKACGAGMRRTPEVIDVWFDSGAMPVAQWHYPFENEEVFDEQFPADFISEAVDQTRGWFYSLHAIATLLFDQPCFLNCISLGLILDAEGDKMSKSKGNVVDPWAVLDVHGADALRWYLFTATPPGEARRFSVDLVGESLRRFFLTLWNTYAFFVTYANIDGFDPTERDVPVEQRSALDRWILSELHSLAESVDGSLEHYDVTGAARPIETFVDDLSNWYVRRSRRRFWRSERDQDKAAAYLTLYECLTTLAGILAPFTPFISEAIYQNLVGSVGVEAPASVHLTDYPEADTSLVDEGLMADTRLVMRAASLGHAARNKAGIKLRQPLARGLIKVAADEQRQALRRLSDQLMNELNVKGLDFVDDESAVVDYRVRPVPAEVGPKYGELLPKIQEAVAAQDANTLARQVQAGEPLKLGFDDEAIELLPSELEVSTVDKGGFATAHHAGLTVAVETQLSDELRREGLAREVVRRIQRLRKEADFRIEDTIVTYYLGDSDMEDVLEEYKEYVAAETLSEQLHNEPPPEESQTQEYKLDGYEITLGVLR